MGKIDYNKIIENKSEKEFYEKQHDKVLKHLSERNHSNFLAVMSCVGGSDRRMLRLLNEMLKSKEIILENGQISRKGQKRRLTESPNGYYDKYLVDIMKNIYKNKPVPTFLFDQRPVTVETTIERAKYLSQRGDMTDKEIVLIGDDDLTSISIALLRRAKNLVVFDIDKRLVEYINKIAKEHYLPVKAYEYDLTKNIPKEFYKEFDVFLTDPTPSKKPFSLFVAIGLNLLKDEEGKVGYVSFYPSHQIKTIDFQRVLTDFKVIITDMIPKFTEYSFIKETYRKEDFELLNKFAEGKSEFSFHENFTRIETIKETLKKIPKITSKKEFYGKATKMVIQNLDKDPAYINGEKDFAKKTILAMQK